MSDITLKCKEILKTMPEGVTLVAAIKQRTVEEVEEALSAGIKAVGENYVQEAAEKHDKIGDGVTWHMIGHLQRNKVKYALNVFDCIQSVDSLRLADEISKQCCKLDKTMAILLEVNIAGESSKYGLKPEDVPDMLRQVSPLPNLRVEGLMTMEPYSNNPEDARPYFKRMKALFEEVKSLDIENVEMKTLSMGMSGSYEVAIEEGSNMVRIGTKLFGPRTY